MVTKDTYNKRSFLSPAERYEMEILRFQQLEIIRKTRLLTKGEKREYLDLINTGNVQEYLRGQGVLETIQRNKDYIATR